MYVIGGNLGAVIIIHERDIWAKAAIQEDCGQDNGIHKINEAPRYRGASLLFVQLQVK